MRLVVTGATGNVGTSVVRALGRDERVETIVGIARRLPDWRAGGKVCRRNSSDGAARKRGTVEENCRPLASKAPSQRIALAKRVR